MLVIHAILTEASNSFSLSRLDECLNVFFSRTNEGKYDFAREGDPFDPAVENILMTWNGGEWWTRFFLDEGRTVAEECKEIALTLEGDSARAIAQADKRVRVLFGPDDGQRFTNHFIWTLDFFEEIPSVYLYDPQKGALL
jgi:hypothetical protein